MIKYCIKKFEKEDKKFFKEMIPYLSQYITEYKVYDDYIEIYCENLEKEEEIKDNLKLVEKMICLKDLSEQICHKIIEDYTFYKPLNNINIYNNLIQNGDIREITKGAFAYSGLFLKVFEYFQKKIDEFGYLRFNNIKKIVYPNLHTIKDYVKGRYFETFPHHIMFQTTLKNDLQVYEEFSKCSSNCSYILNHTKPPQNVLRHAACVPIYSSLENKLINSNKGESYIVSGKCFRNEETNICELSRLNEFSMKEFVFIGNELNVNKMINISKELIKFWIDTFKLNSKYETASDSFFANNYKKLKFFQMLGNSKQEFKTLIPANNQYIASSSINYHRTHFCKPYQIRDEHGNYCYSACFAFGIERLAYTLLSQKGLDPNKWDKQTIKELEKYI